MVRRLCCKSEDKQLFFMVKLLDAHASSAVPHYVMNGTELFGGFLCPLEYGARHVCCKVATLPAKSPNTRVKLAVPSWVCCLH